MLIFSFNVNILKTVASSLRGTSYLYQTCGSDGGGQTATIMLATVICSGMNS